ncbi:hypothetical protein R2F61_02700 [Mollicutes bacterium LVI A0078]|nr:hypothetical protein RZE84_02730 [Mollicutes bacterium LVI A0075]WOO91480.1 hypothetical protein R2F61_02700 [Mollicutes bacterium LVI A0078]
MKKYMELCEAIISKAKKIDKEKFLEVYKQISLLFIPLVISFVGRLLLGSYLIVESLLNVFYLTSLIAIGLVIMFKLKYKFESLLKISIICSLIINIILLAYTLVMYIDLKVNLATYSLKLDSLQQVNINIIKLLVLIVLYSLFVIYVKTHLRHKD